MRLTRKSVWFLIEDGPTEDEQSVVVLDPNHPLMAPYQKALKEYLVKQEEKFNIQLREVDHELKVDDKFFIVFAIIHHSL